MNLYSSGLFFYAFMPPLWPLAGLPKLQNVMHPHYLAQIEFLAISPHQPIGCSLLSLDGMEERSYTSFILHIAPGRYSLPALFGYFQWAD